MNLPKKSEVLALLEQDIALVRRCSDEALDELPPTADGMTRLDRDRALKVMLLMALYGIANEARLCSALRHDLLLQWFLAGDALEEEALVRACDDLLVSSTARRFFEVLAGKIVAKGLVPARRAGSLASSTSACQVMTN